MPTNPEDFFAAAHALSTIRPPLVSDEVCARTMAGRMYYAAYHALREAIRRSSGLRDFDINHTALSDALSRAADADVQLLGRRLQTLRKLRERADYKLHRSVTRSQATLRLADARYVLDNADRLSSRFPRMRKR